MCGRMTLTHPNDALARLFDARPDNDLPTGPRFNICPTQPVVTVHSDGGQRRLGAMRWGFLPHWYKTHRDGPLLINARGETVADKPAFRQAVRSRRCLIAATGFYEWTKDEEDNRLPWYFTPASGAPLVLGGIWQDWSRGEEAWTTCAVVTIGAGPEMARLHHREPLALAPEDWATWLGETDSPAAPLMQPAPDGFYRVHRVDRQVNSNKAEGPDLVEPLVIGG
ncbi:MAG: SOS response-associated peptidase [Pseudomonadota bacterium]